MYRGVPTELPIESREQIGIEAQGNRLCFERSPVALLSAFPRSVGRASGWRQCCFWRPSC